jgi:nucleoside phosphorylase
MFSRKHLLILTPTPNEYKSVNSRLSKKTFSHLLVKVIQSGPGKIHAAFNVGQEFEKAKSKGINYSYLVGAGTSGSLNMGLKSGDMIVSTTAIISDWVMDNGEEITHSPYGIFDYQKLSKVCPNVLFLENYDSLVVSFLKKLRVKNYKIGNLLTSDAFICGKERKLSLGKNFNCLACDMESGVFAYLANKVLKNVSWFNFRVVADTLDDVLDDYFVMEKNMTEILGEKVLEALEIFDDILSVEKK